MKLDLFIHFHETMQLSFNPFFNGTKLAEKKLLTIHCRSDITLYENDVFKTVK